MFSLNKAIDFLQLVRLIESRFKVMTMSIKILFEGKKSKYEYLQLRCHFIYAFKDLVKEDNYFSP